jgi:hypothetical protein
MKPSPLIGAGRQRGRIVILGRIELENPQLPEKKGKSHQISFDRMPNRVYCCGGNLT